MKRLLISILLLSSFYGLGAQNLIISQIDTQDLLLQGKIHIYASLTDPQGQLISNPALLNFSASELGQNNQSEKLNILEVKEKAGLVEGIDFLLLVDNSGSMYDPFQDASPGTTRMSETKTALSTFFGQISESKDSVQLVAFNTFYTQLSAEDSSVIELNQALQLLEQPESDAAYTELYISLVEALDQLKGGGGRKAIIVLSDGENFSYSEQTGKEHPLWGTELGEPMGIAQKYLEGGVTLYAVNFAPAKDPLLDKIALDSGGITFDASDAEELENVYSLIRNRINNEVRLSIEVPDSAHTEHQISLSYTDMDNNVSSDQVSYLAPLLLGSPAQSNLALLILLLILAIVAVVVIFVLKFERSAKGPEVFALNEGLTVALDQSVTVIGSSPQAHLTLANNPAVTQEHATIIKNENTGAYTLVSSKPVRVNNNVTQKRELKPGDVIGIEGATIVFDK